MATPERRTEERRVTREGLARVIHALYPEMRPLEPCAFDHQPVYGGQSECEYDAGLIFDALPTPEASGEGADGSARSLVVPITRGAAVDKSTALREVESALRNAYGDVADVWPHFFAIEAAIRATVTAGEDRRRELVEDAVKAAALAGLYLPALCHEFGIADPFLTETPRDGYVASVVERPEQAHVPAKIGAPGRDASAPQASGVSVCDCPACGGPICPTCGGDGVGPNPVPQDHVPGGSCVLCGGRATDQMLADYIQRGRAQARDADCRFCRGMVGHCHKGGPGMSGNAAWPGVDPNFSPHYRLGHHSGWNAAIRATAGEDDTWTALCDLAGVEGDSTPAEVLAALSPRETPVAGLDVERLARVLAADHQASRNHGNCTWSDDHSWFAIQIAAEYARLAAVTPEPVRHGRHCPCSACARQGWTLPYLAPCDYHGIQCAYSPAVTPEPGAPE